MLAASPVLARVLAHTLAHSEQHETRGKQKNEDPEETKRPLRPDPGQVLVPDLAQVPVEISKRLTEGL